MKRTSWEIIIAGLFFVGIAVYIIGQHTEPERPKHSAFATDSIRINIDGQKLHVVELKKLEHLKNLENLQNLENLKNITNFLPVEIQQEIETEINKALSELEQESVNVQIDREKGVVSINKEVAAKPGSWTVVSPGVFAYVQEFDASTIQQTNLSLPFGSIAIKGGSGKQIKFTVEASGQVSSKADLESIIHTSANMTSEQVDFEILSQKGLSENQNINLQATLSIPENMGVTSTTKAGHITSENIRGNQTYETLGGHINLENISGDVTAKTSGGHITVNNSEGALHLQSLGGHIKTRNTAGPVFMKTSGGNLTAEDLSGPVQANTNGGNIELHFTAVSDTSEATTGAGTISIWVPQSVDSNFDLSGNTVEIESNLNFQGTQSSGAANGSIGSGKAFVSAKTNYGKVILKSSN